MVEEVAAEVVGIMVAVDLVAVVVAIMEDEEVEVEARAEEEVVWVAVVDEDLVGRSFKSILKLCRGLSRIK